MPAIIQDEKQARALKEIEEDLNVIETLNTALLDGTSFSVTAMPAEGKPVKIDMIDAKYKEKLMAIFSGYKKRLSKDISGKAEKYNIALSEKERQSLE